MNKCRPARSARLRRDRRCAGSTTIALHARATTEMPEGGNRHPLRPQQGGARQAAGRVRRGAAPFPRRKDEQRGNRIIVAPAAPERFNRVALVDAAGGDYRADVDPRESIGWALTQPGLPVRFSAAWRADFGAAGAFV
jgi:hypothetical protein